MFMLRSLCYNLYIIVVGIYHTNTIHFTIWNYNIVYIYSLHIHVLQTSTIELNVKLKSFHLNEIDWKRVSTVSLLEMCISRWSCYREIEIFRFLFKMSIFKLLVQIPIVYDETWRLCHTEDETDEHLLCEFDALTPSMSPPYQRLEPTYFCRRWPLSKIKKKKAGGIALLAK